jgi:phosphoserine phosphatase RsbU/P
MSLVCAVPMVTAQTNSLPAAASEVQPFDATNLREPAEIGTQGLVQAGDDLAYAQPDFDDSKWLPVDSKTLLKEYFPHDHPHVVWRRIHVKVAPTDTGLALQAYFISRAFEVYVNGQKLIESGQVEPYVPYTRNAQLIVRIPEAQLRAGSVVIAIRARAPQTWWTSVVPIFRANNLTVGDESALRDRSLLNVIGENAAGVLEVLVALGVGLVALALFIAQRNRVEYLWIFLLGAWEAIGAVTFISSTINLPASWWSLTDLMSVAEGIGIVLVFQAFLRERFSRMLWLFIVVALLIRFALQTANLYGTLPALFTDFSWIFFGTVFAVILPLLVWRQMKRGNREAGILLIPLFFYSMEIYALIAFNVLLRIPPLHGASKAVQLLLSLHIGIFRLELDDIGGLIFFFSLAVIMVLRSTRMSRQQAALEGELAAAREVQRIVVPEQTEAVQGFDVESVYEPAQQVGGDFFQVLPAEDDGLLVVVGDVAGKGLPAAMLVSVLVGAIRGVAEFTVDPAKLLESLNERLIGRTHGGFSTALAAHITEDGWVTIANAGHLSPYLDGRELELPGALPLGVISGNTYATKQFYLAHGSRLTFYSDGVVEAQNAQGELFGFERARAISTQPAAEIVAAAKQFGQEDDITVVAVARHFAMATAA